MVSCAASAYRRADRFSTVRRLATCLIKAAEPQLKPSRFARFTGDEVACPTKFAVMVRENVMPSVFDKLNLKDQNEVLILNAPESFEPELATLRNVAIVRDLKKTKVATFSLAFVTTQQEVDRVAPAIARKAQGDAIVWFAYPKGTSKKYKSHINRDNGWNVLGAEGFEPVRMVAIDEDWSAIRFRRVEFLKNMTRAREHRLTEQAKRRSP